MRQVLILVFLFFIGYALIFTVAEMPPFGCPENPANNMVSEFYIEQAVPQTRAVNVVASIIMDFRAFDTLGEATVLFVAIAAALSNLKAH